MPQAAGRILSALSVLIVAGCAGRSLPPYERPLARAQFQTVRTTAYTHTESDHTQYSNRNACGDCLQSGEINSAACDWSRWPVGTTFTILETGEHYLVDDYGWALAGTNTIDLYKPSRAAMNRWGVRRIHLQITHWGDVQRSLSILRPRSRFAHVRRMLTEFRERSAELSRPMVLTTSSIDATPVAVAPMAPRAEFAQTAQPVSLMAASHPLQTSRTAPASPSEWPPGSSGPSATSGSAGSFGRPALKPFTSDPSR